MPFSSSYHTCGPRSLAFAPARGLNMHRPVVDDSPCSHPLVFRALLREKEVIISNTSGRRRDVMLSLHVLARHNNNIGGSLHNRAPQQRRENFLLRKPERMVIFKTLLRVHKDCARGQHVCMFLLSNISGDITQSQQQIIQLKTIWSRWSLQRAQAESGRHRRRHLKALYLVAQDALRVVDGHGCGSL